MVNGYKVIEINKNIPSGALVSGITPIVVKGIYASIERNTTKPTWLSAISTTISDTAYTGKPQYVVLTKGTNEYTLALKTILGTTGTATLHITSEDKVYIIG